MKKIILFILTLLMSLVLYAQSNDYNDFDITIDSYTQGNDIPNPNYQSTDEFLLIDGFQLRTVLKLLNSNVELKNDQNGNQKVKYNSETKFFFDLPDAYCEQCVTLRIYAKKNHSDNEILLLNMIEEKLMNLAGIKKDYVEQRVFNYEYNYDFDKDIELFLDKSLSNNYCTQDEINGTENLYEASEDCIIRFVENKYKIALYPAPQTIQSIFLKNKIFKIVSISSSNLGSLKEELESEVGINIYPTNEVVAGIIFSNK